MPATRSTIAVDLIAGKLSDLVTAVIDLEDAVADASVDAAEYSLVQQLARVAAALDSGVLPLDRLPLLFIRVRSAEQMARLLVRLEDSVRVLTGFVFPKFTLAAGERYFRLLDDYNRCKEKDEPILYGMPILESASIIYRESRLATLLETKRLLDDYRDYVLNVRIGATDFSSLFGLRRSPELTVYDLAAIRDCIADIMNIFGRADDGYVVSGPVWEYFDTGNARPHHLAALRETRLRNALLPELPIARHAATGAGMGEAGETFIREIMLDKENGMVGKTVIHPVQLRTVQAMYTVTHEEYMDAIAIIDNRDGTLGVMKSEYGNKMNEMKPHYYWARKIIARANIYGVLHDEQRYTALFREQGYARL
jgi:citrate lyase beta subunit